MSLMVLELAVKASCVIAAAALINASIRNRSAAARHLVWTLAIVALLALPIASVVLPVWPVAIPVAARARLLRLLSFMALPFEGLRWLDLRVSGPFCPVGSASLDRMVEANVGSPTKDKCQEIPDLSAFGHLTRAPDHGSARWCVRPPDFPRSSSLDTRRGASRLTGNAV